MVEKWIKNTLSVFNPLKLVNLGVFRGFRDDFLDGNRMEGGNSCNLTNLDLTG